MTVACDQGTDPSPTTSTATRAGPQAPSPKEESSSHPDGVLGMGFWGQAPQEGPTYQSGYSESGFRATSGLSLW